MKNIASEQSISQLIVGKAGALNAAPPVQLATALKDLVGAWKDYKLTQASEVTKRHQIESWRSTKLEKIRAQERLVHQYLKDTFAERASVFDRAFAALDKGLGQTVCKSEESSSFKIVDAALAIILQQVSQSPLEGLNSLLSTMEDSDGTINI